MAEAELEATAENSAEAEVGVQVAAEGTAKGNAALAPISPSPPETGEPGALSGPGLTIEPVAPTDVSPQGASAEAPVVSAAVPPSVPAALVLRFAKDCWVDIRDADGDSLAYGVMKAGSVSELSGAAPFSLVLGNAPAATIEINGELVSTSVYVPQRGTVSRFVLAAPTSEG
jgi:cytoskeleton protein RodZ